VGYGRFGEQDVVRPDIVGLDSRLRSLRNAVMYQSGLRTVSMDAGKRHDVFGADSSQGRIKLFAMRCTVRPGTVETCTALIQANKLLK
jgi:hypothetical protein